MIRSLDHLVLTVADLKATLTFYVGALGMTHVTFEGRHAVAFGSQKINLHEVGKEFSPRAAHATAGSGDLCFLLEGSLEEAQARLASAGIEIEEGPVARTGASGPLMSIYLRDPDQNLIELSVS
ncbi:UNVERIFIED_CONTAM: hypothetical protein GTU68_052437 [Idotea baltica]|nr:hypothetical protein [Idotea baltica]